MERDNRFKDTHSQLRQRAEQVLNRESADMKAFPGGDIQEMIHELQVHQIELEMQNEELRRTQIELEDSRNKYFDLYDLAPIGYLTVNEEGLIQEVNLTAADLLGVERRYLIKRAFSQFIALDFQDVFYLHRKRVFETRTRQSCELKLLKRGGTSFHVQVESVASQDAEGRLNQLRTSISDITELKQGEEERKQLEAQLHRAQKMQAVGTLAGGIAHDFNNLLMAIQGQVSLLLLHIDSDHSYFKRLKKIEDSVRTAADLTKQLLGFARGGKCEVKATNLNELVEKSSEMFGRTRKEIKIHRKYQKDILPVEVDRGQIEQVLLNLYVNAGHAMPLGGDLYIETSNVVLDEKDTKSFGVEPGNYVRTSVTDTGMGMDEATQDRIFEPFFSTREMGHGTGLGLASAYGIMKNHGGFISVYSKKGEGTAFNIFLRASEKELRTKQEKLADEILKGTEAILLVDDEHMILDVGQEILREMGYKVLLARSGKEAVEVYRKYKDEIDLVILDVVMPDMGGGEAYDRMKEINPDVKVLLSSGYSIDGEADGILARGCNGFIQKPFTMKELSGKIREILKNK
jgi:two-component system cell cycle sensor histidine kinase/response regulator CckA